MMARGYFDEEAFNATHSFILSGPIFGAITIVLLFVFFPIGIFFGIIFLIVFVVQKSEEGKERSIARMYCQGRSLHDISEHHAIKLSEVRRIVRMGKKQRYIKMR